MQTQITEGYLSDVERVEAEMQVSFEDLLQIIKELPGGNSENPGTAGATVLAGDAFAVVDNYQHYALDGQGGAADDLKNITGTVRGGAVLYLRAFDSSRPITVKNAAGGAGQIYTLTGGDVVLKNPGQYLAVIARGAAFYQLALDHSLVLPQLPGGAVASTLNVASGACTPTSAVHLLTTGGTAQNLDTINTTSLEDGRLLFLVGNAPGTAGQVVTIRHGVGNITTRDGANFALNSVFKGMCLRRSGSNFVELFRWGILGGGELPALGSALQVLRVNSGGTALEFASSSAGASVAGVCNLRLTLSSGEPVTTSDVLAASTLYAALYGGNQIGLYDGSAWSVATTAEMSISLSGLAANSVHDVFVYNNAGTPTLELTAWTNDTTRATSLVLQDGVLCRSGALTRRYLGTICITSTVGQCEDSLKFRGIDNFYNRIERPLRCIDTTNTWTYTSATWRPFNNSTTLGVGTVKFIDGLGDKVIDATACGVGDVTGANGIGVGVNSTSTPSGLRGSCGTATAGGTGIGRFIGFGRLGANNLYPLESSNNTYAPVFYGDNGGTINQSGLVATIRS